MMPATALTAFADDKTTAEKALDELHEQIAASLSEDANYNYADDQAMDADASLSSVSAYPDKLDLRDRDYVTDVRFQNPWGTCWAFGLMAASEVSVLSESSLYTSETLDLSERHLAWFAKTHLPDVGEEGYDPAAYDNQSGEGTWYTKDPGAAKMSNATMFLGTSTFASGMGPVTEYSKDGTAFAPYRNDEGILIAINDKGDVKTFYGDDSVEQAKREGYTADFTIYSAEGTWSLDESKRFTQTYALEESNLLPDLLTKNTDGSYELNEAGINAYKKQLNEGRGIAIGYCADQGADPTRYISKSEGNYYEFTWDSDAKLDHCVAIVGYDDTISKENFKIVNPVKWDSSDSAIYRLKATGEDLKNVTDESGRSYPADPVTGKPITDSALYEPSTELGSPDTEPSGWVRCKILSEGAASSRGTKLTYNSETELTDGTNTYAISNLVCVVFKEDGVTAKRDESGNVLYKQWSTDGKGTGEEFTDISGKTVVEIAYNDVTYKPEGDGAWIVKNSWGGCGSEIPNKNTWGNQGTGYFYLSYYDRSTCLAETYDFAVTEAEQSDLDYSICYEYDYMPASKVQGSASSTEVSMANKFTASENSTIENLSCETWKPNSTVEYQVYKLRDGYENPTDGTLVATASKTYDYAGYHRVDLDTPVYCAKGDNFSVVATVYYYDTSGAKQYTTLFNVANGVNKPGSAGDYVKGVINEGESYLLSTSTDGSTAWRDWKTEVATLTASGEYAVDNLCIKAYAEPASGSLEVASSGANFTVGDATSDAVFVFGENLEGFGLDNFDTEKGVTVDDATLGTANYKVEIGSIKLTLFKSYLNTLSAGTHQVHVYLKDSDTLAGLPEYVEATLTVSDEGGTGSSEVAKTGDTATGAIIGCIAVSAAALAVLGRRFARRRVVRQVK